MVSSQSPVPQQLSRISDQSVLSPPSGDIPCLRIHTSTGSAKCCFGGEENEGRVEPILKQGDVVIVPAGAGHRLLEDYGDFQMVGSYLKGKTWNMCYGKVGEEEQVKQIESLVWFQRDPMVMLVRV